MRRNNAFAIEEVIGIVLIIGAILFLVSSIGKRAEKKEFIDKKKVYQEQEIEGDQSKKEILELSIVYAGFDENAKGEYLEFQYRVANIGQKEVFFDHNIIEGKNLFFEMISPQGDKILIPRKLGTSQQKEISDVTSNVLLVPGKFITGSSKFYHRDYPNYAAGRYSTRAYLTTNTSLRENRGAEKQSKIVSSPYPVYIPDVF